MTSRLELTTKIFGELAGREMTQEERTEAEAMLEPTGRSPMIGECSPMYVARSLVVRTFDRANARLSGREYLATLSENPL